MCECFRRTGGHQHVPCSCSHRQLAMTSRSLHGTQQEAGTPLCWGQEMILTGLLGMMELEGSSLAPQVPDVYLVAQIQTKWLVASRMSNPLPIYGHFPSHTTLSHISPDFCWDFALPRLQDLPRAAHGSYLLCSSTFAHRLENFRRHSRLAYLHHSSPPSLVLFLPCSGNCILWYFFFAHSVQSPTSCRVPLLFFPHVINSLMQFPVICSLVPLVSRHHQMPSYLKLVIIYIQRPSSTISLTADQE